MLNARIQARILTPNFQSQSLSQSYRFSLPTSLTYFAQRRLEAVHLRDLLRLWARSGENRRAGFVFQGQLEAHQTFQQTKCIYCLHALPPNKLFQGVKQLTRKDNAYQGTPLHHNMACVTTINNTLTGKY